MTPLQEAVKLAERNVNELADHADCAPDWLDQPCRNREIYELSRALLSLYAAARKVAEVRAKLHRGECVGEELTEALDALCEAAEPQP